MNPRPRNTRKAGSKGTKKLPPEPTVGDIYAGEAAWAEWWDVFKPLYGPFQPGTILASEHLTRLRAEAAKRPRTRSARPIGKLPFEIGQGGLDAALWPWFRRWIENPHNRSAAEWHSVKDKRRYFVALVVSLVLPAREAITFRANADAVAPKLTRRALPLLRRRLAKMTLEDYVAVTRNPSRNPSPDDVLFSARSHDKRAKLRAGLESLPKFSGAP